MKEIIVFCAQYLFLLVILLIIIAWFKTSKNERLRFVAAAVLAGIIALILSRIASKVYYDPRPFVAEHVQPLFPHIPDNGFPSDHALLTGTLTAITYLFSKKYAYIMALPTIIIGVARVAAKVHSPLDIAGGWAFGIIGAMAGYYIVSSYLAKHPEKVLRWTKKLYLDRL